MSGRGSGHGLLWDAVCAAAVLLVWLPQYVIAYPGSVNPDTASQLRQALGWEVWDDKHPLIMTLLIDGLVRFGRRVGSGNAAFVLYTAAQGVFGALVLGYCQAVMRRLGAARWLRWRRGCGSCTGAAGAR